MEIAKGIECFIMVWMRMNHPRREHAEREEAVKSEVEKLVMFHQIKAAYVRIVI
jgi:hypothetical protein